MVDMPWAPISERGTRSLRKGIRNADSIEVRIAALTGEPDPNGCVKWLGYVRPDGYGLFKHNRARYRIHRLTWEMANGPIPAGLVVDHLCFMRDCINIDHLQLLTSSENSSRKSSTVFSPDVDARTQCGRGHLYTPENTRLEPRGKRGRIQQVCRECTRANARRTDAARRERERALS